MLEKNVKLLSRYRTWPTLRPFTMPQECCRG